MDRLIEDLCDLDPAAPPSSIDLDAVVRRARRRTIGTRTAVVAGFAALTVVAAAGGTQLWPSASPPAAARDCAAVSGTAPAPVASPTGALPSEPAAVAASRLTTAVSGVLRGLLPPDVRVVDDVTCSEEWSMAPLGTGQYVANLDLVDAIGTSRFFVRIGAETLPDEASCAKSDCIREELADGTVRHERTTAEDKGVRIQIDAYRPAGVAVFVSISNTRIDQDLSRPGRAVATVTRPEPTLTVDALRRIVQDPSLTLLP